MLLQKFEKYVVVYAGAGSWLRGEKSNDSRYSFRAVTVICGFDIPGGNYKISPAHKDSGKIVEGDLRPSSDTPAHLELYRAFADIGAVAHTRSPHATAWAQAKREIPALGTTHADYCYGPIPCTRLLSAREIADDYEASTGQVIAQTLGHLDPARRPPGVLVAGL